MSPDIGVLSDLLRIFEAAFQGGYVKVQGQALSLLGVLVAIEIAFLGLWCALGGSDVAGPFLKKLIVIGFFVWVVKNFDWLTAEVLDGFTDVGKVAANASDDVASMMVDPSAVLGHGFTVTKGLFEYVKETNSAKWFGFAIDSILAAICALCILAAFFIIALQIFITKIEFAMVTALGLILVPFGAFKHTAFLAEKIFGAIISFGIKLMVLTFIVAVSMPLLTKYSAPADGNWDPMLNMVFISFALMYLAWHAPNVVAGLLSGGPSLSGLGMVRSAAGALGAVGGASAVGGAALTGAVGKAALGVMSGGGNLVRAAAGALGGGGGGSAGGASGGGGEATSGRGGALAASGAGANSAGGGGERMFGARDFKGSQTETLRAQGSGGAIAAASGTPQSLSSPGAQGGGDTASPGDGSTTGNPDGGRDAPPNTAQNKDAQSSNSKPETPITKEETKKPSLAERVEAAAKKGKEVLESLTPEAPNPTAGLQVNLPKE